MLRTSAIRVGLLLVNLITPGVGLLLLGYWRMAITTLVLLTAPLVALCWSRVIFLPVAIQALLMSVVFIYFVSSVLCFRLPFKLQHKKRRNLLFGLVLIIIALLGLMLGFMHKDKWLGIHIYFVPSMSMYPTFKPGEYILVDSWAFHNVTPQLNDLIIFQHGIHKINLIKRISLWPQEGLTKKDLWYVKGDNADVSQDSRYFGGIKRNDITGHVRLKLTFEENHFNLQEVY